MANPSSSSQPPAPEKPVIVRVKRKASQARLDTLWLEIDERPAKRALLDFGRLSINDSEGKVQEEPKTKKLLVQHVETVNYSEATKEVLQSLLPDSVGSENIRKNVGERKSKQYKPNQDKLVARKKHEEIVRSARFEQIWKSRRGSKGADDYSLREFCHLYDVVRVDTEEEKSDKDHEAKDVSAEDNAILCNFLPLMREFLPTAAEEIESDMKSYLFKEDDYVYDLYTVEDKMEDKMEVCKEGDSTYPLVHVKVDDDDDWYDGPQKSEYESDDSNAEDNPRNDYPDESTTEDEDKDSSEDDDKSSDKDDGRDSSEDDGYYDYDIDSEEYEKEIDGDEVSGDEDMK